MVYASTSRLKIFSQMDGCFNVQTVGVMPSSFLDQTKSLTLLVIFKRKSYLAGHVPEDLGHVDVAEVTQVFLALLSIASLLLKVQLLSQGLLHVLHTHTSNIVKAQFLSQCLRSRKHTSNAERGSNSCHSVHPDNYNLCRWWHQKKKNQ